MISFGFYVCMCFVKCCIPVGRSVLICGVPASLVLGIVFGRYEKGVSGLFFRVAFISEGLSVFVCSWSKGSPLLLRDVCCVCWVLSGISGGYKG